MPGIGYIFIHKLTNLGDQILNLERFGQKASGAQRQHLLPL